jgi:hypothetical protein
MVSTNLSRNGRLTMTAITRNPRKININKVNLFLDLGIALAFVIEMEEHFTGLQIHELLGLAFAVLFTIHLLLHWKWVVNVARHFFKRLFHESRFNFILNLALLIALLVVTVSGIAISRTLGLNLAGIDQQSMKRIHTLGSQFVLILVGLHVAMHWKWIADHTWKYLFTLPVRLVRQTVTTFARTIGKAITPIHNSHVSQ